jgi:threonylcarbamoyladenosine tRNA methylthiotransferase MtaB
VKAYLQTFGCRANQYDTEAVRALILAAGGEITESAKDADIAVMNSCAVTAEAESDLRRAVRGAATARPGLPVIVMGCASARDDGRIAALPGVSHVIGGADLPAIAMALNLDPALAGARAAVQTGSRALLRIQDGCDEHCTFCATTLARGASRSRSVQSLEEEAAALAAEHPEIVITGIHIGSYGTDIGSSLGALMTRLVRQVPLVRFRLSSLEATEIDEALAELLADDPSRVAPHLHAPLQSGSDGVLRRMGRHWYSAATYAAAIERLASRLPVFGLGADVMTGFPGETAADHGETVALVQSLPFTYLHVFPYSARPGTAAGRLGAAVDGRHARERAAELRAISDARGAAHRVARAGGRADIVVVGTGAPGGRRHGLTEDYLSVSLDDSSIPRRSRFSGTLQLKNNDLVAVRS